MEKCLITKRVYRAGEKIVDSKEKITTAYFLNRGKITLTTSTTCEKTISERTTFLEIEAFRGARSPYEIKATTECEIFTFKPSEEAFATLLDNDFALSFILIKKLAKACYEIRHDTSLTLKVIGELKKVYRNFTHDFCNLVKAIQPIELDERWHDWKDRLKAACEEKKIFKMSGEINLKRKLIAEKRNFFTVPAADDDPGFTRRIVAYKKGETIFKEGELGNDLYILLEGKLEGLVNNTPQFQVNDPGSVVGELSLLVSFERPDMPPRTAGIRCLEDTKLMVLKQIDFIPFMTVKREVFSSLINALIGRTQESAAQLKESRIQLTHSIFLLLPEVEKEFTNFKRVIDQQTTDKLKFAEIQAVLIDRIGKIKHQGENLKKLIQQNKLKEMAADVLSLSHVAF